MEGLTLYSQTICFTELFPMSYVILLFGIFILLSGGTMFVEPCF